GQRQVAAGRPQEAEKAYRQALAIGDKYLTEFPTESIVKGSMLSIYTRLGWLLRNQGRLPEAEAAHRKALDLAEQWVRDVPGVQEHRDQLARAHVYLAGFLRANGRPQEANVLYRNLLEAQGATAYACDIAAWRLATCADPKLRHPALAVELAQKAVELAPQQGMYWNTL